VFKVRLGRAQREKVKGLYRDVICLKAKAKSLLYYREEWENALENAVESRARAGKRTPPKAPPLHLLLRFILPDGTTRGNKSALCVVDLRRGELRIPSYELRVPLRPSLVRALLEENGLEPRPEFVLQITRSGKLRIVARRAPQRALTPPTIETDLLIITIDENSRHGFSVAAWLLDLVNAYAALAHFEKLRPPNHGVRRQIAAALQSFAEKPTSEGRERLAQLLPEDVVRALTPERAKELAALLRRKEKRLNNSFLEKAASTVRKMVRKYVKVKTVLIIVEPIDAESVLGTPLQGTLLRVRKALRNLARYEGAWYHELRASGKRCPRCGREREEVVRTKRARIYHCPRCGLRWDRDKGVHYNMVKRFFERMLSEECDDENALVTRVIIALEEWLERHPNILTY